MAYAKQRPSGKWQAMYRLPNGAQRSAGTFQLKREARAAAVAAEAKVQRPNWTDPAAAKLTWGEWCEQWWPARAVEPSTLINEESMVQTHLAPQWADIQIGQIRRHDVQAWVNKLISTHTLAPSSARRVLNVLVSSLTAAIDAGLLDANPATRIDIPNAKTSRHVYLTQEQFKALLENVGTPVLNARGDIVSIEPDLHARAIISFLAGTGLRWGEMAGLHWEHLHEDRVEVTNVISAKEIKPYPKSRRSRTVPVPKWVRKLITWTDTRTKPLPYRKGAPEPRTGLVFLSPKGGALDDRNFSRRILEPALQRAGLEDLGLTLHDLRHTYASWLIQAGIPLEVVSDLLGHASWQTTQIYAHLRPTTQADLAVALKDPFAAKLRLVRGRQS